LPGVTGVLVLEVPAGSVLAKSGLQKNDVILSINRAHIADVAALRTLMTGRVLLIGISRNQQEISLSIMP
jgi:S1-C subfamily serine protease